MAQNRSGAAGANTVPSRWAIRFDFLLHRRALPTMAAPDPNLDDLNYLKNFPVTVGDIRVKGARYTDPFFIEEELASELPRSQVPTMQLHQAVERAMKGVIALNIFRKMDSKIVLNEKKTGKGGMVVDVEVNVKEKSLGYVRTQATRDLASGENKIKLTAAVRNRFGRAEKVEASYSHGNLQSRDFMLDVSKPRWMGTKNVFQFQAFLRNTNMSLFRSVREISRGCNVSLTDANGRHTMGMQCHWRDISPCSRGKDGGGLFGTKMDPKPSPSVLRECIPSLKSSIYYRFVHDRTDTPSLPSSGYRLEAKSEFAGVGGDVRFIKSQLGAGIYVPFVWSGVHIGLNTKAGVITPLPFDAAPSHGLLDRFSLGGPLSVRGFRESGIGPQDGHDSLGE